MLSDRPDVRGGEDPREIEMTRRETTSPEASVAKSAVFPRNWASFRPVARGGNSSCGLRFLGYFLCTCRYIWASFKSGGFTPCVTLRAVLFNV